VAGVAIKEDPSLHQLLPANILSAGEIRVASDIPYPPFEMYVGTTSQPTGFDYDLSQAIGAVLGIKVSFNEQAWASIILSVQDGKYDMVMSDMSDSPAREKVLSFVDYVLGGSSVLVLKGNPQGITSLDSLSGKTVCVETATTQAALLQSINTQLKSQGKKPINILALPDQPSALLAVKSGRAVGAMSTTATSEYTARTTNNGATFEVIQDPAAPNGYDPTYAGIGIAKTNTQLVTAVQKALQALIDNGAYTALLDKYGVPLMKVQSAMVNAAGQPASASPTP
jgi:polar amino acid transport system substrate-binding protein